MEMSKNEKALSFYKINLWEITNKSLYLSARSTFILWDNFVADEIEDLKDYRTAGLKRFLPSASTDFEIVADSTEGIRCHIDELFYADVENPKKDAKHLNTDIIEALQELEWEINSKESEYIRWINETRVKLYNEWRENCERYLLPK